MNSRANYSSAQRRLKGEDGYYADEDRSQRHTLCLRDVAYSISADVAVRPGVEEDEAKYRDQFQRRVRRGQCHNMPYLGCREFTANFGAEPPVDDRDARVQDITADLGQMLFDLDYERNGSGRGTPRFFHARLSGGYCAYQKHSIREEKNNDVSGKIE